MTLEQAAAAGYQRVRLPYWAFPDDYLLIDIVMDENAGATHGPWGYLYSQVQLAVDGMDRPQTLMLIREMGDQWEPYLGPPAADERRVVNEPGPPPWLP